ncbi:MAG TPA: transporter substrate-binding domain-containing protein [Rhodocyclaceae bacterium]
MSRINRRRGLLAAVAAVCLAVALPAAAEETQIQGTLRIAVYKDFAPYSFQENGNEKGIDADLGRALAQQMGLKADVASFKADDDMADDLRNMIWKGHYLGYRPGDVMMHVPVDARFAAQNDKVRIFGPYHVESVATARDAAKVPPPEGSSAVALEVFTREKIGVEGRSVSDSFLLGVLNGRIASNVTHFKTVAEAVAELKKGGVAAVMGTKTEIEAALAGDTRFPVAPVKMPEMSVRGWAMGMAVKNDNPQLAEKLDRALSELEKNGTVASIFARYGVSQSRPGG